MGSSRKNRRNNRKSRRNNRRSLYGGQAPVNWSNPGPMQLSLGQGVEFEKQHAGQHGGMGPYPGSVTGSMLPSDLAASARINPTLAAYAQIRGLSDQAGGRKRRSRKGRKGSRKGRKGSRKNSRKGQRGGLVRWGGRRMRGGAAYNLAVDAPSMVGESTKMLIPPSLQAQAGLHPEWKLVEGGTPSAWMPK